MRTVIAIVAAILASPAAADEVSKNAGICAIYSTIMKNDADAAAAMRTAPNQQLAKNAARQWANEMKEATSTQALINKAVRACAAIGLR